MAVWSTVPFSRVLEPLRLDAEYWKPVYLEYDRVASQTGGPLPSFFPAIIQPTEFIREYVSADEGAEFWRAQNVRRGFVNRSTAEFIDLETFAGIGNAQVKEGDVLIVRTGANAADAATVPAGIESVAVSSHTLRLVPRSVDLGYALGLFFAGDYGHSILERITSGSTRPQITKDALSSLILPDFSEIAAEAREWTLSYYNLLRSSKACYAEAEAQLAAALGLDALALPTPKTYTAPFSEVQETGRLGAEYFHPQKRIMRQHLAGLGGRPLREHVRAVKKLVKGDPDDDRPVHNIDLPDALDPYVSDDRQPTTFADLGSTKKAFQPGDVVVSRLRSYLKEIAFVRGSGEVPFVGSSEFIVLRPTSGIAPEALTVYLRSEAAQVILKWSQSGSAHPRFDQTDLLDIPVPDAVLDLQDDLVRLCSEAVERDRDAARLLAEAVGRVEALVARA